MAGVFRRRHTDMCPVTMILGREGDSSDDEVFDLGGALDATVRLTARERDVFDLLGLGLANRSIARQLNVSEPTVKAHISKILDKLDVESRTQAAITAFACRICVCRADCGPGRHRT